MITQADGTTTGVVVVNPNRDRHMTQVIADTVDAAAPPSIRWRMVGLDDGPPVIETDRQFAAAERVVATEVDPEPGWTVLIACHGDPGVGALRTAGRRAVGIGEASMLAGAALADRFAVLSLTEEAAARKWRQLERYGLNSRCATVVPTGPASLLGGESVDPAPYLAAARRAAAKGAGALVLGCAGMASLATRLQADVGLPVIEPVSTAFRLAADC